MSTALTPTRWVIATTLLLGLTIAPTLAQTKSDFTMSVVIVDHLQLMVNHSCATRTSETADNCRIRIKTDVNKQLTVTSNQSWGLRVQASSDQLTNGRESMPVGNIHLKSRDFGGPGVHLSTTSQRLITGAPAIKEQKLSLEFITTSDNEALLEPDATHPVTLLFTIASH